MSEPAIRNWRMQPPTGGWSFNWTSPTARVFSIQGFSSQRVVDKLRDVLKVNRWYVSEAHLWAICNDAWRKKCPERAIHDAPTLASLPTVQEMEPNRTSVTTRHWMESKPAEWGPRAWAWLHMFGVYFDASHWMMTVERIRDLLDPAKDPTHGCRECFGEFLAILRDMPPDAVTNEQEAAAWSFEAHNRVNRKRGVTPMRWAQAAKIHKWKVNV